MPSQLQATAESERLQKRMQDIVDEDLMTERRRQVEDLAGKVATLEADRRKAREELRITEQQHEALVSDAKLQLAQVEAEHDQMQQDIIRLKLELEEAQQRRRAQEECHERNSAERASQLEAEVQRLTELRRTHEEQIESCRGEVYELRKSLESLHSQRARAKEETGCATQATKTLQLSLEDARRQLEASEQQRLVLRDRYLKVGEQFEQALGLSEKESQLVISELKNELRRQHARSEKYQKRLKEAQSELQHAEAGIASQKAPLEDRQQEIQRLRRVLEGERSLAARREAWYMECQQQQMLDQSQDKQQLCDMVSVPVHERLLEDQARHFRERLADLERRLRQSQEEELEEDAEEQALLQQQQQQLHQQQLQQLQRQLQEQQHQFFERKRGVPGMSEVSSKLPHMKESRSSAKVRSLEAELAELKVKREQVEQREATAEKQQQTFSVSLTEASSNISRLQKIVEEERESVAVVRKKADEAAEAAKEIQEQAAARKASQRETAEAKRLQRAVEERAQQVEKLEERRARQRNECEARRQELAGMESAHEAQISRLHVAEQQAAQLEHERQQNLKEGNRRSTLVTHLQRLLKSHVSEARSNLHRLRKDAEQELGDFQRLCQTRVDDCIHRLKEQQRVARLQALEAKRGEDLALHRKEVLQQELAQAEREGESMEKELQQLRQEEAFQKEETAGLKKVLQSHALNVERVLSAVTSALPASQGLDAVRARLLAADGLTGSGFPDVLLKLQQELEAAFERAGSLAAARERERLTASRDADVRQEAASVASTQAEVTSELAELEARHGRLSAELRRRKAEARGRAELRAARLAELGLEATEQEALLQKAELEARNEEATAEKLAAQLGAGLPGQGIAVGTAAREKASEAAAAAAEAAAEALRRQLRDLLEEVADLERRFADEASEKQRAWEARSASEARARQALATETELRLQSEAREARRELQDAEKSEQAALQAAHHSAEEKKQRLAHSKAELEEARKNKQRLEAECEVLVRHEELGKTALKQAEHRLSEAQSKRRTELAELDARRSELRQQQEQELDALRRGHDAELSRARSLLQQSISSISAGDAETSAAL